jgi:hypothetical protein
MRQGPSYRLCRAVSLNVLSHLVRMGDRIRNQDRTLAHAMNLGRSASSPLPKLRSQLLRPSWCFGSCRSFGPSLAVQPAPDFRASVFHELNTPPRLRATAGAARFSFSQSPRVRIGVAVAPPASHFLGCLWFNYKAVIQQRHVF